MKNQSTPKALRELLTQPAPFVSGIGEIFVEGIPSCGGIIRSVRVDNGNTVIEFSDFVERNGGGLTRRSAFDLTLSVNRAQWHNGNILLEDASTKTVVVLRPSATHLIAASGWEKSSPT